MSGLSVEIAGVRARIDVGDSPFREVVERRYGGFLSSSSAAIRFHFPRPPVDRTRAVTGLVVRDGSTLRLEENAALGFLDEKSGIAELAPHPSMMGLDMLLRALVTLEAVARGGLALHAASVELDGRAHVFMGGSGDGKTTLARKLQDEGARVLSDEMTVLHPSDQGWIVHGTPYRFGSSKPALLDGLWTLRKGPGIAARALSPSETHRALIRNLCLPIRGDDEVRASMASAARLAAHRARELTSALGDRVRSAVEGA